MTPAHRCTVPYLRDGTPTDSQAPTIHTLELRHVRSFIAVAEELSYRKAATRLHVTQPALTRTIQQLELGLGAQLLERGAGPVRLTTIGHYFLEQAKRLVADLLQTVTTVHKMRLGQRGELRVGFNDFAITDLLPKVVQKFRGDWPDIGVTLIDETSPRMVQSLLERRLDIAFLSGITPPLELESVVLRNERLVAVLPAAHRLATCAELLPGDLAEEPFVMGEPAWSVFLDVVNDYCRQAGFRPRVVQTAVHSNGIINFVGAGIGVTIYVDRDWLHHHPGIVVRPLSGPRVDFKSLAVWRRGSRAGALASLIDVLCKSLD